MLRQGRRMRSAPRCITTPQDSPGYSAAAWDRTRAYSSGVRIIEGGSAACAIRLAAHEGGLAARESWPSPGEGSPAPDEGRPAPGEGRNDRHLVAVLQ